MPTTLKTSFMVMLIVSCFAVSGCNTIEGIGRDAKAAGEKISTVAEDSKGY